MITLTVHHSERHAPYILKSELETAIKHRYQDRAQSLINKLLCRNVNPIVYLENGDEALFVIGVATVARHFDVDICYVNPRGQILNLDLLLDPFNQDWVELKTLNRMAAVCRLFSLDFRGAIKVNQSVSLTEREVEILLYLINNEMDGLCGDRGFEELYKLKIKLSGSLKADSVFPNT